MRQVALPEGKLSELGMVTCRALTGILRGLEHTIRLAALPGFAGSWAGGLAGRGDHSRFQALVPVGQIPRPGKFWERWVRCELSPCVAATPAGSRVKARTRGLSRAVRGLEM